jgi:hypothetical protein
VDIEAGGLEDFLFGHAQEGPEADGSSIAGHSTLVPNPPSRQLARSFGVALARRGDHEVGADTSRPSVSMNVIC